MTREELRRTHESLSAKPKDHGNKKCRHSTRSEKRQVEHPTPTSASNHKPLMQQVGTTMPPSCPASFLTASCDHRQPGNLNLSPKQTLVQDQSRWVRHRPALWLVGLPRNCYYNSPIPESTALTRSISVQDFIFTQDYDRTSSSGKDLY